MRRLRLGTAQINTTIGDFKGNTEKILTAIDEGKAIRFWPYPLLAYT
jgi:predicted amidohydrolase